MTKAQFPERAPLSDTNEPLGDMSRLGTWHDAMLSTTHAMSAGNPQGKRNGQPGVSSQFTSESCLTVVDTFQAKNLKNGNTYIHKRERYWGQSDD